MKLVKAKYANSGADGPHCEQRPRCRFASSFFSRHVPEELTLKGQRCSASPSVVVSSLSLFFWSDYFHSFPLALPPLHTLYLSTASLSHDSATACERLVSHFVLLLSLSSRCGLKGHLFGWDRAPCFCQACLLTQRLSCHVSSWNRCRLPPDEKLGHAAFKKQVQHAHCYEDKWVIGIVWHISMHSDTVQRARSNNPRKVSTAVIRNYSSRSGTVIFTEIW